MKIIFVFSFVFCCTFYYSDCQTIEFPYKLKSLDIPLISTGVALYSGSQLLKQNKPEITNEDIIKFNKKDINLFDRPAVYQWNTDYHHISNVTVGLTVVANSILVLPSLKQRNWRKIFVIGTLYTESILLTTGLFSITKSIVNRNRPYLYNSELSNSKKLEMATKNYNGNVSFFSGHTATAFCSAFFLSKVFTDLNGPSKTSRIIWVSSVGLASFTGFCRFKAGKHFPSDILTGALVGSSIGYLIPVIHKRNDSKVTIIQSFNTTSLIIRI